MSETSKIVIKVKSLTGKVVDIEVAEIISIDGQPLTPGVMDVLTEARLQEIEQRVARLEGRDRLTQPIG